MARPRRRMIDPGLWVDAELGALSRDHRLLFIGTFSLADDEGRLKADPRLLKAQLFPYDDLTAEEVDRMTRDLAGAGQIVRYEADGHVYINHPNWKKHQQIRGDRFIPSDIPPPPVNQMTTTGCQTAAQGSLSQESLEEGNTPPCPSPPLGAQERADQEEAGGDLGEEFGGEEQRQGPEAGTTLAVIPIRFAKPPASDTRANLKNAGYVYDSATQAWTAPATPRARDLAERYRPYLATVAPAASPAPATPPARPPATGAATGAQGPSATASAALPATPAHLQPVLDWLRGHLRPQSFSTWFAPSALAGTAERLEVLTISPIITRHIEDCYLPLLQQACQEALGRAPATVADIKVRVPGATTTARASPPSGPPPTPATEPAAESAST